MNDLYYRFDFSEINLKDKLEQDDFLILFLNHIELNYPLISYKLKTGIHFLNLNIKDVALLDLIYDWMTVYNAIYDLYMDSGDYEFWALKELENINSSINVLGLKLSNLLNNYAETYYYLFRGIDRELPKKCPLCNKDFNALEGSHICKKCKIIMEEW